MSGGDWKDMFGAACTGDVALVQYHLDQGVDVDYAHPELQSTALVASILARQEEVAGVLLDHGADPHLESELDEMTPAQAARHMRMTALSARLSGLGA
ncbi:hypothetical protein [Mumia quercus]|uniref:hypothetical protein n=1 Tax=Mumia quercus TaxID=2976125 RepID=UPI0021D3A83E|nr:hypothetical protein [Mumia quercus]